MIYRTEQANCAMIHATSLIWTKIKRGCGPSCETTAGVWKKALNATVPWGFCPLPARGYRVSDRCCCCCSLFIVLCSLFFVLCSLLFVGCWLLVVVVVVVVFSTRHFWYHIIVLNTHPN
jgi:hypothetical protein